MITLKALI